MLAPGEVGISIPFTRRDAENGIVEQGKVSGRRRAEERRRSRGDAVQTTQKDSTNRAGEDP